MKILKLSRKLTNDRKPHLLFVYIGGHGATLDEKQVYLLNSNSPQKAIFHFEFKLRYLSNDPDSLLRINAVFDCCRVNLTNLIGLNAGRGKGDGGMQDLDSDESDAETPCKYFQIQACGPNGIAEADGGFAKRLYETCSKFAEKNTAENPRGFMIWPGDLAKAKWTPGEITLSGGDDYLVPFGA